MTKTDALRRAWRQLCFGWFRDSDTGGHVTCPSCRERVTAAWLPWAKPTDIQRALRDSLVEHLLTEHGDKS